MASNEDAIRSRGVVLGRPKAIIRPITGQAAKLFCRIHHPTGKGTGNNLGMCFGLTIRDKLYGICTWGYNLSAGGSAKYLFGEHSTAIDYLDNLRLVAINNPAKMQPSAFLSITTKILFQNRPSLKYVVAFADGYHGYRGTIYQAANYLYTGTEKMDCWWLPGYGIMSQRSVADVFKGKDAWRHIRDVHPTIKRIRGYKYRYIRFRDKQTQNELMKYARFNILPQSQIPKKEDMVVFAYDDDIKQAKAYDAVGFRSQPFVPYELRKWKTFRGRPASATAA